MYYTEFDQVYDISERKPWYQKYPLDPSFPFTLFDDTFRIYPFHWHKYLELIYITKGSIEISIHNRICMACEGDVIIVNSELIHSFYNGSNDVRFLVYLFGLELFDQSLGDLCEPPSKMVVFNRKTVFKEKDDPVLQPRIVHLLSLIKDEFSDRKDGYRVAIKKYFYDLALIFLRDVPRASLASVKNMRGNSNFLILERILSYIYDNYDDPEITLKSAAGIASLSKFYFSRFFRERTGFTFHAYLSRFRIGKAQVLLSETDKSITDIAYDCGFASLKTFNRLFKIYAGVSPSSYRAASAAYNSL